MGLSDYDFWKLSNGPYEGPADHPDERGIDPILEGIDINEGWEEEDDIMVDESGTWFCRDCGDDAMESGLFRRRND